MSEVVRVLIERGQGFTRETERWELERWRAMALTALSGAVHEEDQIWQFLRAVVPEPRWPKARRAWSRFAAELGALEGLLLRREGLAPGAVDHDQPVTGTAHAQAEAAPADGIEHEQSERVKVLLLGSAQISGAPGNVPSNRRRSLTELACWIYLHPGSHHAEMDAALAGGRPVRAESRNPRVSKLRSWLGEDALPHYADFAGYRLTAEVSSDWADFQRHVAEAARRPQTEAACLRAALSLVRGAPLCDPLGIRYPWAESVAGEMAEAISRASARLVEISMESGQAQDARWALERGLRAGGRHLPGTAA